MIKTVITWIVMSSASFAVQNSDLFVQANDFYKADNFEAAIQHYNEILITHEHEDIYYNLGMLNQDISINSKYIYKYINI